MVVALLLFFRNELLVGKGNGNRSSLFFFFLFLIMNVMLTPAVIANAMVLPDFLFVLIMH